MGLTLRAFDLHLDWAEEDLVELGHLEAEAGAEGGLEVGLGLEEDDQGLFKPPLGNLLVRLAQVRRGLVKELPELEPQGVEPGEEALGPALELRGARLQRGQDPDRLELGPSQIELVWGWVRGKGWGYRRSR